MALTDFLSDETGAAQGPGTSYVLANKSMDWAAEMEDLDIGLCLILLLYFVCLFI